MDSAALDRKSSIEKEPRTLSIEQIQIAREAALFVLNKKSMEEAFQIFTEGLEPVMSCAKDNGGALMDYDEELNSRSNQLTIAGLRDIVSAPF